jgi:GNAT superfamily N-acetyltransferase
VAAENAANRLLADHGYPELAEDGFPDVASFREMIGDGGVFVATERSAMPIGYAVTRLLGGYTHLRELAVHPGHGRRGLGRALVGAVIAAARKAGHPGVSLSTFRDVPFNQPFYEKMGFREPARGRAPEVLIRQFEQEIPPGIDPGKRVLLVLPLSE